MLDGMENSAKSPIFITNAEQKERLLLQHSSGSSF